jgi:hypothetical protein
MSLELETLDEEEDRRDTYGPGPLGTRVEEKPRDLRGGKDSLKREAAE